MDSGFDQAFIPGCKLLPKAQAERIGQLKAGLFKEIVGSTEEDGMLRLHFPGNPKTADDLMDFIRFERECCASLSFDLAWEQDGGRLSLEIKGPGDGLAAFKDSWRADVPVGRSAP